MENKEGRICETDFFLHKRTRTFLYTPMSLSPKAGLIALCGGVVGSVIGTTVAYFAVENGSLPGQSHATGDLWKVAGSASGVVIGDTIALKGYQALQALRAFRR